MKYKLILIFLFIFVSIPIVKVAGEETMSVETIIGFKPNSTDFTDESEYEQAMQFGKLFKELSDKGAINVIVTPYQSYEEYTKDNLIGFYRFRKLVETWKFYGLPDEMFSFKDKKYNEKFDSKYEKKAGLAIYINGSPCITNLKVKFIKSRKGKTTRITYP